MTESFQAVNAQLEQVYKGLGEMQTLAADVGGLKQVLSGVKTRGILGEIQLGAILEEILAPEQFDTNVATIPGSTQRVEYAVKLPGADGGTVWLPIDSKFPGDTYAHLSPAAPSVWNMRSSCLVPMGAQCGCPSTPSSRGIPTPTCRMRWRPETPPLRPTPAMRWKWCCAARQRISGKNMWSRPIPPHSASCSCPLRGCIREKYVEPPYTTTFGILFLPFEGLYAEVVNMGMLETLQRDYQVNVAGPSTMAALLNSLQMGFRTLAIQKRSGEVWQLLGAVKTEFEKFGQGLSKMQQRLRQTDEELDQLIGVRSRAISRKLRAVQLLDEPAAAALLELDAELQQRLRQTDEELDQLIGVRSRAISRKLRAVQLLDEPAAAALLELDAEPGRPAAARLPQQTEE